MGCDRPILIKRFSMMMIFLLILAACQVGGNISAPTQTEILKPTADLNGLSADAAATLGSLEKIDEYPFYVMHFSGAYAYPKLGSIPLEQAGFGCALFASLATAGDKLFGRNFDWEFSPALLVFTDPPDGYASASMVDLTFLGISSTDAGELAEKPVDERTALLSAPALPFDGMNEYGLAVGMAAIPDEFADDTSFDPSRPTIGSIGVIRQVLDHARDVDEAVEIFGQYNVQFSGGPPIHYLLADASGKAVLVEFYQGEMIELSNENPWHLATNHLRCTADGDGGCWRYRTISNQLTAQGGSLDAQAALSLLSQVKQDITQWSTVYNMTSGDIQVVIGKDYQTVHNFHLDFANP